MHGSTRTLSNRYTDSLQAASGSGKRWKNEKRTIKAADKSKTYMFHVSQCQQRFEESTGRRMRIRSLRVNHDIITKYRYVNLDSIISCLLVIISDWAHLLSLSILVPERKKSPRQALRKCLLEKANHNSTTTE